MFLDKIDDIFRGTGEKNKEGQTLEEFLEAYNPDKYEKPSCTVDMAVIRTEKELTSFDDKKQILLIKRKNHPCIGMWTIPGGFVGIRENLIDAARRELFEETGVKDLPMEQLLTYGKYDMDPRMRVITTPFLSLIEGDIPVRAGDDADDAAWFDIDLQQDDDIYHLEISKDDWHIEAFIKEIKSSHRILPQKRYEVIRSKNLDECHCILILQSLIYLKEHL